MYVMPGQPSELTQDPQHIVNTNIAAQNQLEVVGDVVAPTVSLQLPDQSTSSSAVSMSTADDGKATFLDWSLRWSDEGKRKRMPTMQGVVHKFVGVQGAIGMHGGLPPPDAFPFSTLGGDLAPDPTAAAPAGDHAAAQATDGNLLRLVITDPSHVALAQQYIMTPKGYQPLHSWAYDLMLQLHKPATLPPSPVGFDVTIAPGASAALDALARILLNPGDPVLLEEFSYSHHVDAHLLQMGCELVPVSMDHEGLLPAHLDQLMTQRQAAGKPLPRVLYTIPVGQNPTGATMSSQRMSEVYAVARKWDLVVVEDDAYYWLQFPHGPQQVPGLNLRPGFLSIDVDGRVVRVDTFAKLLGPGYRLGWVSGPPPIVQKLSLHFAAVSVGSCSLSQVLLHQLIQSWGPSGFEAFVKRLQRKYAQQALAAAAAAEQHLSDLAEWQPVTAGMFLWVKLKDGSDAGSVLQAGAEHKVLIIPGYLTSAQHLQIMAQQQQAADLPVCPYFRVSFASVDDKAMLEGFARLRAAILSRQAPSARQMV